MAAFLLCSLLSLGRCQRAQDGEPRLDPGGQMLLDPLRDDGLRPAALLDRLRLPVNAIVGDVGAGPGYLTLRLAAALPAGRVIATELRSDYLAALAARARRAGLGNVETRSATVEDSGLLPGSVDLVVLCQVDHYLRDRAAYLSHLRAALRPHGRIAMVNYTRYLEDDRDAAAAAGLRIVDEWSPSVAFFLLVLDEPSAGSSLASSLAPAPAERGNP